MERVKDLLLSGLLVLGGVAYFLALIGGPVYLGISCRPANAGAPDGPMVHWSEAGTGVLFVGGGLEAQPREQRTLRPMQQQQPASIVQKEIRVVVPTPAPESANEDDDADWTSPAFLGGIAALVTAFLGGLAGLVRAMRGKAKS